MTSTVIKITDNVTIYVDNRRNRNYCHVMLFISRHGYFDCRDESIVHYPNYYTNENKLNLDYFLLYRRI